jgi:hypothetical protein
MAKTSIHIDIKLRFLTNNGSYISSNTPDTLDIKPIGWGFKIYYCVGGIQLVKGNTGLNSAIQLE